MRTLFFGLLLTLTALACNPVRQATYPKSFKYLEKSQVQSDMVSLAKALHELDGQLRPVEGKTIDPKEVQRLLQRIDQLAGQLDPTGLRSNHARLDANINAFRKDVQGALASAQQSPPNYFLAGAISGSCSYCHR